MKRKYRKYSMSSNPLAEANGNERKYRKYSMSSYPLAEANGNERKFRKYSLPFHLWNGIGIGMR